MEEDIKPVFVIDASYILAALMPDEQDIAAIKALMQYKEDTIKLLAPSLTPYEVTNTLWSAVRRKRVSYGIAQSLLREFINLKIEYIPVAENIIFKIAHELNISCYDAAYVALAREKRAELLTYDERLRGIIIT